ncbi:MAG: hypothetical protein WC627_10425 [Legionella sp.]|jgi:hypothetical protein
MQMQTIGKQVNTYLRKMQTISWVLNETGTEYLLVVPVDQKDDFIFNYLMRVEITELYQSPDKSFWYSWPDIYTGTITIHNTNLDNANGRDTFVVRLLNAMNKTTRDLEDSWESNSLSPSIHNNDRISPNTKEMILEIAKIYNLKIQAHTGCNGISIGISCETEEAFSNLRQHITQELTVPPLSVSNQNTFFSKQDNFRDSNETQLKEFEYN